MPLNIDHWIIQLWDQLNLSISQGFRYKPRGAIANPGLTTVKYSFIYQLYQLGTGGRTQRANTEPVRGVYH